MLFEATDPAQMGARKFLRIENTILVSPIEVGGTGAPQFIDIARTDEYFYVLKDILRLPSNVRLIQLDAGIVKVIHIPIDKTSGTIIFSETSSTIPLPLGVENERIRREETVRIASEQYPSFKVNAR